MEKRGLINYEAYSSEQRGFHEAFLGGTGTVGTHYLCTKHAVVDRSLQELSHT